jgi:hypothetical protein
MKNIKVKDSKTVIILNPISFRIDKKDFDRIANILYKLKDGNKNILGMPLKISKSDFYRFIFKEGLRSVESKLIGVHTCDKCGKRIAVTVPKHLRDRLDICNCPYEDEKNVENKKPKK